MKKKLTTLLPLFLMAVSSVGLASCKKGPTIGILQPVEHAALGAARDGFIAAVKESHPNINFDYRNAGGNDADLQTFAKNLIDTSVLTLGIGTGAAKALQGASVNAGSTKPIVFTAVTDPVVSGLVASKDNPSGFICGTTDANPVEAQIALIKEFKPTATKVGIMYTQTEENSKLQAEQAGDAAVKAGMQVVTLTCSNSSDIKSVAENLVTNNVDAIYIPTDNNIAANMNAVKQAANSKKVLVVSAEENQLKEGGHITLSIDYYQLGFSAGRMAAQIISGTKNPTDFKVEPVPASNCAYVYSSQNLRDAGLTMPETMKNAHSWKDINA